MYKRVVVKIGTSVLTGGTPRLDRAHMVELVRQCARACSDHEMIICSSGAIAAGRENLGFPDLPATVTTKQLLAAVGQTRLIRAWENFFRIYDIHVGQVLLTRADVHDRNRFLNARDTLAAMIEHNIIPIVNENDAVATAEIRVGDNDNLSALLVALTEADLLVMLTDQAGLYTADPRTNPEAELIQEVDVIDDNLHTLAGGSVTGLGVGGMTTKLQAADIARRSGADVVIASGTTPDVIIRILAGEPVGTRFPALKTPLERRKRWILAGAKPNGTIAIDKTAVESLHSNGGNLLPSSIVRVDGHFQRGDTVTVSDENGFTLGRGVSSYDAAELNRIMGRPSDEISTMLGYTYGTAAIHRDDLVLLGEN
ncbi:MAG: glutamate 5-kinase [Rhodothermales bacterium]|nr:glutamate 5-kinase [Rhodothermales bacterium]